MEQEHEDVKKKVCNLETTFVPHPDWKISNSILLTKAILMQIGSWNRSRSKSVRRFFSFRQISTKVETMWLQPSFLSPVKFPRFHLRPIILSHFIPRGSLCPRRRFMIKPRYDSRDNPVIDWSFRSRPCVAPRHPLSRPREISEASSVLYIYICMYSSL